MITLANEKNKKIGIFGLARTGIAAYRALKGKCATLIAWDDSEKNRKSFKEKCDAFALKHIDDTAWRDLDEIVLSPGIPTKFPRPHKIVQIAKEHNIKLISDLDLLYRAKSDKKIIAITGTNGKSTCASLIHHILNIGPQKWDLGGNIGNAALNMDDNAYGYVIEISSFQIELSQEFKADIGVLLNVTPDHLDRHGTMEEYIKIKKSLIDKADIGVIGLDNEITLKIYNQIKRKINIVPFSNNKILDYGISIKDGEVYNNYKDNSSSTLLESDYLIGKHNLENIAASIAVCKILDLNFDSIIRRIVTFKGLPHRLQYLGTKEGIDFYNDSKATNMESMRKAVQSLNNIHLLAGGVRKKDGIEKILDLKNHIAHAYFYGEAAESFAGEAGDTIKHGIYNTLEESFNEALNNASKDLESPVILLSPGCTSFDQFKDFEDRGYRFIELYDKI